MREMFTNAWYKTVCQMNFLPFFRFVKKLEGRAAIHIIFAVDVSKHAQLIRIRIIITLRFDSWVEFLCTRRDYYGNNKTSI